MLMNAATEDVKALIANGELDPGRQRLATLERFEARVKDWRVVPPGGYRVYEFSGLSPPEREDTVIQVRFKLIAQPLPPGELGVVAWTFVDPDTGAPLGETRVTRERSNETHQFLFRGAPAVRGGRASLVVEAPYDPDRPTYLIFDGEDSLQLLYRVGGFGLNFVRALLLVFLRLALLSAIGVFFSVFVSFPVACLCTAAFFIICLGYPFWVESMGSVEAHDAPEFDPYGPLGPAVRVLLAPLIRYAFPNFSAYDGGQALVDGEYVSYGLLARCAAHTLLYGGLLLLGPGWMIFRSREVAEVQV